MGDCRIRILVSQKLLPSDDNNASNDTNTSSNTRWKEVTNKLFSTDTTVREVCNAPGMVMPLLQQQEDSGVALWDCTVHPPKDITDWPLKQFSDIQGLRTKTLFDAGWFPSGTLRICLKTDGVPVATTSSLQNDEAQYNLRSEVAITTGTGSGAGSSSSSVVQLVGNTNGTTSAASNNTRPLLPSQLLDSVTHRFEDDDAIMASDHPDAHVKALQERRKYQQVRAAKEQERFRKLEGHIQSLESNNNKKKNKNKPVSDQVRRMLIKSRATGAKSLKQQDRVYFHIVILASSSSGSDDADAEVKEVFCYFSRQETAAKILSNFADSSSNNNQQSELLVRKTADGDATSTTSPVYRRLPNVMRVYEAIEQKWMEPEVNKVVIRWYDPASEEATTSVAEDTESSIEPMEVEEVAAAQHNDTATTTTGAAIISEETVITTEQSTSGDESTLESATLAALLRQHDEEEQKKSKKKCSKSSTSTKVRQMLMKSKAKGDAKRLKMEDRFFFELVTVAMAVSSDKNDLCETSLHYLGKKDPLGRILRDCVEPSLSANNQAGEDIELLVPIPSNDDTERDASVKFQRLRNLSMTFHEAEAANLLQPFGRLVIRFRSS